VIAGFPFLLINVKQILKNNKMKVGELEVYELFTDEQIADFFAKGPVTITEVGKLKFINDDGLLSMPKVNVGDIVNEDFSVTETDGDVFVAKKKKK
jgi:hypothetical protein